MQGTIQFLEVCHIYASCLKHIAIEAKPKQELQLLNLLFHFIVFICKYM